MLTEQQACHVKSDSEIYPPRDISLPCSEPDWKKVAFINMTDPNQHCPHGLHQLTSPIRMCGRNASSDYVCNSTIFSVGGHPTAKCVEGSEAINMDQHLLSYCTLIIARESIPGWS